MQFLQWENMSIIIKKDEYTIGVRCLAGPAANRTNIEQYKQAWKSKEKLMKKR